MLRSGSIQDELTLSRGGWHTTKLTFSRQFLTSCITWSRGALKLFSCKYFHFKYFLYRATSSPLIESIWSPGISLSTLGPPPVTNLKQTNLSIIQDKSWINLISILSSIFRTAENCWGDFQRTSVTEIVSKTLNPTSGGLRRGKEVEGGGQFDPPYLKALKSHSKVAKWV